MTFESGPGAERPTGVRRVIEELARRGFRVEILSSGASTRTAAEAAASLGTSVAQIVKSLVFVADSSPVVALVSGVNRLDEAKLSRACGGATIRRANADEVRDATGYAIGGVPPAGHGRTMRVLCDQDLLAFDVVYAAAGTPHHNFAIAPSRLVEVAGATVADLRLDPRG